MDSVGLILKRERKKTGKSQEEVAKDLGIPRSTLANYERNDITLTQEITKKICKYFGITSDYLLGNNVRNTNNNETTSELDELKKAKQKLEEGLVELSTAVREATLELIRKDKVIEAKSEKIESLYDQLLHNKKTGTND